MGKKMKPAYEDVQPEELKPGDKVFCEFNGRSGTLVSHDEGDPPWMWTLDDGHVWGWEDQPVFRQLPPERNPDVLMRAMELLFDMLYDGNGRRSMMDSCIQEATQQAIRELESEAFDLTSFILRSMAKQEEHSTAGHGIYCRRKENLET